MTLNHLLWLSPAAGTTADCIGDDTRMLSYAEVDTLARAFAEQLTELGVSQGDVVGVMLENSIELVVGILGTWLVGAIATPINPTFTERELTYQLGDSEASLLLADEATLGRVPGIRTRALPVTEMRTAPTRETERRTTDAGEIALLIYTSGSTGQPKGVMLDHANLNAMTTSFVDHVDMTEADRALLVLPMFHVNAISLSWLSPITVGGSTVIVKRFAPVPFTEAVARHRPTFFSAVPAILARLVELPPEIAPDFSSVRFVICGAAPVSRELLQLSAERFYLRIIEGYGLTEGTCASTCNPLEGPHKLGSVGPVLPGQRIKLTDDKGNPVPTGERGEIRISGPNVMRGYLGRPEATAETIVDGWLRTGDVGVLDEDGYLRIVDRMKDMIIRGGENIYPKEIETHLATHPAVLEAAVVGAPHATLGEVPVAFVVALPGAQVNSEELIAHCAEGLAKIKVPAELTVLEELPRNPVGKIDKPELRRRVAAVSSSPETAVSA